MFVLFKYSTPNGTYSKNFIKREKTVLTESVPCTSKSILSTRQVVERPWGLQSSDIEPFDGVASSPGDLVPYDRFTLKATYVDMLSCRSAKSLTGNESVLVNFTVGGALTFNMITREGNHVSMEILGDNVEYAAACLHGPFAALLVKIKDEYSNSGNKINYFYEISFI